jgi:hypothetical protein
VEEDEPDEAVLEGGSSDHEQRHNRGEEQRGLELDTRAEEGVKELGREGKKGR